ncbi:hypothetical protein COMNV_01021 [Commensalibacter sp. Nvir]|uniref:hypothetical protein n=1 Tax=Commensalibacter sp. Nvir TaxID=3069817 RepID=UPI002D571F50|nr:hypothetical protein COMNV_01021 [Commensalibacter sp. Nvir]
MNIKNTLQKTLLLSISFFALSTASFASTLTCPANLPLGAHQGHFTDIIDITQYAYTNYIFQSSDLSDNIYCVQINPATEAARAKAVNDAFLLNRKVSIEVDGNHNITGIGYRNDE